VVQRLRAGMLGFSCCVLPKELDIDSCVGALRQSLNWSITILVSDGDISSIWQSHATVVMGVHMFSSAEVLSSENQAPSIV